MAVSESIDTQGVLPLRYHHQSMYITTVSRLPYQGAFRNRDEAVKGSPPMCLRSLASKHCIPQILVAANHANNVPVHGVVSNELMRE